MALGPKFQGKQLAGLSDTGEELAILAGGTTIGTISVLGGNLQIAASENRDLNIVSSGSGFVNVNGAAVSFDGSAINIATTGGAGLLLAAPGNGVTLQSNVAYISVADNGQITLENGGGYISMNAAGVVVVNGVRVGEPTTVFIPVAVKPNDTFSLPIIASGRSGTIISAAFVAAVAATSTLGDITAVLQEGTGPDIGVAVSIDGETTLSLDVGAFTNGFSLVIESDNLDATQPVGGVVAVTYTTS